MCAPQDTMRVKFTYSLGWAGGACNKFTCHRIVLIRKMCVAPGKSTDYLFGEAKVTLSV